MSESGARMIVTLLVNKGIEANCHVQDAQIRQWAAEVGFDDLLNHFVSASELGWIETGPMAGTTSLSEAGSLPGKDRQDIPSQEFDLLNRFGWSAPCLYMSSRSWRRMVGFGYQPSVIFPIRKMLKEQFG